MSRILKQDPDTTLNETINVLRKALSKDQDEKTTEGFKLLMKYDLYSTRQFLSE
jgi:hypothetical protein